MPLAKEVESYVASLRVGETFVAANISHHNKEVNTVLPGMNCVSKTGGTEPRPPDSKGGKMSDIWVRTADLQSDLDRALKEKARGVKMAKQPSICNGCRAKKGWFGCHIANTQYWNQLK